MCENQKYVNTVVRSSPFQCPVLYLSCCVCSVLLCCFLAVGQTNLPAKQYGASFEIECDTTMRVDVYSWTLNGTSITAITVGIDSTTISERFLLVELMTLALEGQYECFAPDNQLLDTINVFVIGKECSRNTVSQFVCIQEEHYTQGMTVYCKVLELVSAM